MVSSAFYIAADKSDGSSESSAESEESVIAFNEPLEDEESEEEDSEESYHEGDAQEAEEEPAMPLLSESVLRRINELIPPLTGYYCTLSYDSHHHILHIAVPPTVVATWLVRKNVIQHLYAHVPLLRQLLDQGTLEISFTRGVMALINRYTEEVSEDEPRPPPPRSVKEKAKARVATEPAAVQDEEESRDSYSSDRGDEKSRDSVVSFDQGANKCARAKVDSIFADMKSRATTAVHMPVGTYNGPHPNYRENLTHVKARVAQYKEQWFSEKKPLADYDTWCELQDSKFVEKIKLHLARVEMVSVHCPAMQYLTRDICVTASGHSHRQVGRLVHHHGEFVAGL